MLIKVLVAGVKKNHKIYITMCPCLATTIPEIDLKEVLWRNLKKNQPNQFNNSIVQKKQINFKNFYEKNREQKRNPILP